MNSTGSPVGGRVFGIAPGDPLAATTWSGTSARLFGQWQDRGRYAGGADSALPAAQDVLARAAAFHPDPTLWRERSNLGRLRARLAGDRVQRGADSVRATSGYEALVQVGSWCRAPQVPEVRRSILLDSNFAQLLARTDVGARIRPESRFARWRLEFESQACGEVDVVFTLSEWTRQSVISDLGVAPDRVVVTRPGPNSVAEATEADLAAEPAERRPGGPRYLFVGKKWERKGGPEVLDAFAQVRRALPDAELWVVGPEEVLPARGGVRYFGRLDRRDPAQAQLLTRLFTDADAFVLPSRYEPFGMVFLEAMHRGLAVVGADHCAMPEIVADGQTGYLVPPRDPGALAEVLLTLGRDPELARELGRAGQARAVASFTWSRCVSVMERELFGVPTPTPPGPHHLDSSPA